MSDTTLVASLLALLLGVVIGRLMDLFGATGLLQTRNALANERIECERLREIIFNSSGADVGSGRDGSGDVANCARAHFPSDGDDA